MDATAALNAITTGDYAALLSSLDVDERRDIQIDPPPFIAAMGAEGQSLTLVRSGVMVILVSGDKMVMHGPHDNTVEAAECWASWSTGLIDQHVRDAESMGAVITDTANYSPVVEAEGITRQ